MLFWYIVHFSFMRSHCFLIQILDCQCHKVDCILQSLQIKCSCNIKKHMLIFVHTQHTQRRKSQKILNFYWHTFSGCCFLAESIIIMAVRYLFRKRCNCKIACLIYLHIFVVIVAAAVAAAAIVTPFLPSRVCYINSKFHIFNFEVSKFTFHL